MNFITERSQQESFSTRVSAESLDIQALLYLDGINNSETSVLEVPALE